MSFPLYIGECFLVYYAMEDREREMHDRGMIRSGIPQPTKIPDFRIIIFSFGSALAI